MRKLLLPAVVVAMVVLLLPGTAGAQTGHSYSTGYESSSRGNYTGVSVYRYDRNVAAGGTCNASYSGNVIYQTQWQLMTSDSRSWIELGTMHKTSTCKYWFWGYGVDWTWYSMGTQGGVVYDDHTFRIVRGANGTTWSQIIDNTTMGNLTWGAAGNFVQAGLESYNTSPTVSAHGYYSLQYNQGGPWYNWSGRDGSVVNSPMCGRWVSDTTWQAGQNTTCT